MKKKLLVSVALLVCVQQIQSIEPETTLWEKVKVRVNEVVGDPAARKNAARTFFLQKFNIDKTQYNLNTAANNAVALVLKSLKTLKIDRVIFADIITSLLIEKELNRQEKFAIENAWLNQLPAQPAA